MYVIPKTYVATAYILVVPQANAEATSTPTLVSTYQDILRSPEVVDQVAQKMERHRQAVIRFDGSSDGLE